MRFIRLIFYFLPLICSAQENFYILSYPIQNNYYQQQPRVSINERCSGSIIHTRWILTSASCVTNAQNLNYNVVFNTAGFNSGIERVILHPNYIQNSPDYDIALLRLNADVAIQPISLDLNDATDYRSTTVLLNSRLSLNPGAFKVVDESFCAGYTYNYINLICAISQQSSCPIDAGSPVIYNNRQIGLEIGSNRCDGNTFHVFTRLSRHSDWLSNQLAAYGNQLNL